MKKIIQEIFQAELSEKTLAITGIKGFGSVNEVFEVKGEKDEYIIRINNVNKRIEYQKERWCIDKVGDLGIPTPEVLRIGVHENSVFMIQKKIDGVNGVRSDPTERAKIWRKLGNYAATYQRINKIEDKEVERNEFHDNWRSRLNYNLNELTIDDSLLKKKVLSSHEQRRIKEILASLEFKDFDTGLVHGDLSPRNVIVNGQTYHLLDWGTAEINIIPHTEIGILLTSEEASSNEFQLFLSGFGISYSEYMKMENEINILNLLIRLDKYRWAEGHRISNIEDYSMNVRKAFDKINPLC